MGCDIYMQHVDPRNGLEIFANAGKFAIGSFSDARTFIGSRILVSSMFSWNSLYYRLIQSHFEGKSGYQVLFEGFEDGAAYIADISPLVPPEIRNILTYEEDMMKSVGSLNYVLCGPVYDTNNNLRIANNTCPSLNDLYSQNWFIRGTIDLGVFVAYPTYNDNRVPVVFITTALTVMSLLICLIACFVIWTYVHRDHPVIKFAQPVSLYIVAVGCAFGLFSIIPISYQHEITDKEAFQGEDYIRSISSVKADQACQLTPWLIVTGFSLTFPVLFLKTWRLHKLIIQKNHMKKKTVKKSK
jgi:hypothetical protein